MLHLDAGNTMYVGLRLIHGIRLIINEGYYIIIIYNRLYWYDCEKSLTFSLWCLIDGGFDVYFHFKVLALGRPSHTSEVLHDGMTVGGISHGDNRGKCEQAIWLPIPAGMKEWM